MHLSAFLVFAALTLYPASSIATSNSSHTFGYTGTNGPLGWAQSNGTNADCSTSTQQSPINIDSTISATNPEWELTLTIPSAASQFVNNGHTLQVPFNGTLQYGVLEYTLSQFHFHTPAEHLLYEEFFPLEMHMVFKSGDAILVIGFLFEVSADDTTELLTTLAKRIPTDPGTITGTDTLDFDPIITHLQNSLIYTYEGSLTTPPCTDGVTWLVSSQTLSVDVATYTALKSVMKFNARYTQNTPGQINLITYARNNYPVDL